MQRDHEHHHARHQQRQNQPGLGVHRRSSSRRLTRLAHALLNHIARRGPARRWRPRSLKRSLTKSIAFSAPWRGSSLVSRRLRRPWRPRRACGLQRRQLVCRARAVAARGRGAMHQRGRGQGERRRRPHQGDPAAPACAGPIFRCGCRPWARARRSATRDDPRPPGAIPDGAAQPRWPIAKPPRIAPPLSLPPPSRSARCRRNIQRAPLPPRAALGRSDAAGLARCADRTVRRGARPSRTISPALWRPRRRPRRARAAPRTVYGGASGATISRPSLTSAGRWSMRRPPRRRVQSREPSRSREPPRGAGRAAARAAAAARSRAARW